MKKIIFTLFILFLVSVVQKNATLCIWSIWGFIIAGAACSEGYDEIELFDISMHEHFLSKCWGLLYIIGTMVCIIINIPVAYWIGICAIGIPALVISIFFIIAIINGIIKIVEYLAMHLKIPKVTINVKVDYWKS